MAKKKPAPKKKQPTPKRTAPRKAARKPVQQNPRKGARVVAKKKPAASAKAAAPPASASRTAPAATKSATTPQDNAPSLGRPKITAEADLDLFFKDDYHARQIFKFLNVQTVKELERYTAGEILRRLSNPIKETVERIRRSLAQHNRCLTGDEEYALGHKDNGAPASGR
ncbi:MAG: hypothetical protein JSS02_34295 [Planctomycetes bacterium]|nr:hypothetical protein [Planctomycetota bacterium]